MTVEPFLYEELASFITRLVDKGTLSPGSRAPSLREISKQRGIGLSTAMQAYRLLEDRGVLEAKPQSGYYVARAHLAQLDKPAISRPPQQPAAVAVPDIVLKLLEYASDSTLVPLGFAMPSADLLAAGRLNRFLARAARTKGDNYNVYTLPKGDQRLRKEIARRALRWGQALSCEDIVVTSGCTEALTIALKAVTKPGDIVATESPTYFGVLRALEAQGLKALELPTDPTTGVDIDALRHALAQGNISACLFGSSFSNPLSCTMPDEKKIGALDLLAKYNVPLIEDDIYGDIYFGSQRPKPFMALDRHNNTMCCSSFSKTVAPGYRIGWIASTSNLGKILECKVGANLSGLALLQGAMADFLASGGYDHHLRRMRSAFEENLKRAARTVEEFFPKGTKATQPVGGFVLWLELPKSVDTRALFDKALQKNICFAPGSVFSTSTHYDHCLRLSCGHLWSPQIEEGIKTLGMLAQEAAA